MNEKKWTFYRETGDMTALLLLLYGGEINQDFGTEVTGS